jgi:chemotaxis protein methyltransferase CheR
VTTSFQDIPVLERADFDSIRRILGAACGIKLNEGKAELVRSRLASRLRALGLTSFRAYVERLGTDARGAEQTLLVNALSTNTTRFFREPHHFEILRQHLIPRWAGAGEPLRIWSAGCSSGQEAYSIAMTLARHGGRPDWDRRILATDISTKVLREGREAAYANEQLEGLSPEMRKCYLEETGAPGTLRVREVVRSMVSFGRLNFLAKTWPMKGKFQAIFCRNALIYFDRALQLQLLERFTELLTADGVLFLGHSESVPASSTTLRAVGPTTYQRQP